MRGFLPLSLWVSYTIVKHSIPRSERPGARSVLRFGFPSILTWGCCCCRAWRMDVSGGRKKAFPLAHAFPLNAQPLLWNEVVQQPGSAGRGSPDWRLRICEVSLRVGTVYAASFSGEIVQMLESAITQLAFLSQMRAFKVRLMASCRPLPPWHGGLGGQEQR